MKKRVLAAVLSLMMLVSLLPAGALAATVSSDVASSGDSGVTVQLSVSDPDTSNIVEAKVSLNVPTGFRLTSYTLAVQYDPTLVTPKMDAANAYVNGDEEAMGIAFSGRGVTASPTDNLTTNAFTDSGRSLFLATDTKRTGFYNASAAASVKGVDVTFFFELTDKALNDGGNAVFSLASGSAGDTVLFEYTNYGVDTPFRDLSTAVTATQTFTGRTLTALRVATPPDKTEYTYGETFDPTGMKVTAVYDKGSPDTDFTGYSVAALKGGDTVATLTAGGCSATTPITVSPAPLTVTANDKTITYGEAPANDGVSYSGFVNDEDESVLGGTLSYSYNYNQNDPVGDYNITPSGLTSTDYDITFVDGTLTVQAAGSGVTTAPTAKSLTYNGSPQALVTEGAPSTGATMQYALGDATAATAPAAGWSTTIPTGTDQGAYTVWYKAVANDANHTDSAADSVNVTIGKAALTVTATDQTVDYGTGISTGSKYYSASGLQGSDALSAVTLTQTGTNVDDAVKKITPSGAEVKNAAGATVTGNYDITYTDGALTINAVDATLETRPAAANATMTYSGEDQNLVTAGSATGGTVQYALGSDDSTAPTSGWTTTVPTGKNADTYYVWYMVDGDRNHNDTAAACATVTIDKADNPAAITATSSVRVSGTLNLDALVTGAEGNVSFVIDTANSTATGCTIVDGTGGTKDLKAGTTAGTCKVNVTVAGNGNYNSASGVISVSVNLKDDQALSFASATQTKTFGDAAFTVTAGHTAGDGAVTYATDPAASTVATVDAATGEVTITGAGSVDIVATAAETDDYNSATAKYTLTVNPAAAAVTTAPTAKSLTYSSAAQKLVKAGTATGGTMQYALGTSSTTAPTDGWSTAIPTGTNQGAYTVWYKAVATDANHTDSAATSVNVTISKAEVTVTASDQTVEYGTGISTGSTYYSASGLKGSDALTAVTLTQTGTNVFDLTKKITPSAAEIKNGDTDVTGNYNITYTDGTLTINSKALTITANAQTVDYGTSITAATDKVTAAGLVSGDALSSISLTPSGYNVTSSGTITPSNAVIKNAAGATVTGNYIITYATGVLTINAVDATLETAPGAANAVMTYNGTDQNLVTAGSATGGTVQYALGSDATNAPASGWTTTVPTGKNADTYYVWYMVDGDQNHNDTTPASVTVTIDKANNTAAITTAVSVRVSGATDLDDLVANSVGAVSFAIDTTDTTSLIASECSIGAGNVFTAGSNPGTCKVNVTVAGDGNYKSKTDTIVVTVNLKDNQALSFAEATQTKTYGDAPFTVTAGHTAGDGLVTYATNPAASTVATVNAATGEVTITGAGSVEIVATAAETDNYNPGSATYALTVNKAPVTPGVSIANWTYGETAATPVVTGNTDNGAETMEYKVKGADDSTYSTVPPTAANDYTLRVSVAATANYDKAAATADFTIEKKEVTLSWGSADLTYSGAAQAPTVSVSNKVGTDDVDVTVTGQETNVGSYTATASGLTGTDNGNYKLPAANTLAYTIAAKPATDSAITAVQQAGETLTYNGTAQAPTLEVKDGTTALTAGTDFTVKYVGVAPTEYAENTAAPTNAGSYNAVITFAGNYSGTKDVGFTIAKAARAVTATPASLVLTSAAPTGAVTLTFADPDGSAAVTYALDNDQTMVKSTRTASAGTVTYSFEAVENGSATATFTVTGANYSDATATVTLTSVLDPLSGVTAASSDTVNDSVTATLKDSKVSVTGMMQATSTLTLTPTLDPLASTLGWTVSVAPDQSNVEVKDSAGAVMATYPVENSVQVMDTSKVAMDPPKVDTANIDATNAADPLNISYAATGADPDDLKSAAAAEVAADVGSGASVEIEPVIQPVSYTNDGTKQEMTVKFAPTYTKTGTTDTKAVNSFANPVEVTVNVPAGFTPTMATQNGKQLEGFSYNAAAGTVTYLQETPGDVVLTDDSREGYITYNYDSGKIETVKYTALDVDKTALPTDSKTDYTFDGWTVGTLSGTYKGTFTSALLDAVNGTTLTATPNFTYSGGSSSGSGGRGGGGGGGGTAATNPVNIAPSATGSTSKAAVTTSATKAAAGEKVTVTVTPEEGYQVDGLKVTDAKGNAVAVTDNGNGTFTFTMPAAGVTIEPIVSEIPEPTPPAATGFVDVPEDAYYADAVDWAVEKGITTGTDEDHFSPNDPCTRAQVVTFLWRAAGMPEPAGTENPFTDVNENAYYYQAMLWAYEQGLAKGITADTFAPNATVTRGQMVTFLYRGAGAPEVSADNAFDDVSSDAYYADAVAWAVEKGITNGTSESTFSPDDDCLRAQIVTFLYRAAEGV